MIIFQDWASIFIVFFRIIWPSLLSADAGLYVRGVCMILSQPLFFCILSAAVCKLSLRWVSKAPPRYLGVFFTDHVLVLLESQIVR